MGHPPLKKLVWGLHLVRTLFKKAKIRELGLHTSLGVFKSFAKVLQNCLGVQLISWEWNFLLTPFFLILT